MIVLLSDYLELAPDIKSGIASPLSRKLLLDSMPSSHHATRHLVQRTAPTSSLTKKKTAGIGRSFTNPRPATPQGLQGTASVQASAVDDELDDDMATSFLQYCAMCEKQILVPNNSILYCSESCRRRDGPSMNSPYYLTSSPNSTTTMPSDPVDLFGVTTRAIPPTRKPTYLQDLGSKPPVLHNAKSDLDPTEWKPDLKGTTSTEAFEYLSKFHRKPETLSMSRRPALQGRSTAAAIMMSQTAPSLSHTPTTSTTSSEGSIAGTPDEFVATDLQSGADAALYSPSLENSSVDPILSIDNAPTPVPKRLSIQKSQLESPIIGEIVYEKKWIPDTMDQINGSLKKLFMLQPTADAPVAEM